MRLFSITILLMIQLSSQGKALWQQFILPEESVIKRYDTNYVQPLLNKFTVRTYLNLKQNEINFNINSNKKAHFIRSPDYYRYGLGFSYRYINVNLSYGLNPYFTELANGIRLGSIDVQININGRRFLYDIRTQWYNGFTLDNKNFREDINLVALGGSFRYNFNHKKYSLKSSINQAQWQVKSAGSPIAGVNFSYLKLQSDTAIFWQFVADSSYNLLQNWNAAIVLGYSYTYVFRKHWFATLYVAGNLSEHLITNNSSSKNAFYGFRIYPELRTAIGYNSEKYWLGLTATFMEDRFLWSDHISLQYQFNNYKFLFARRFNYNPYQKKVR